MAMKTGRRRTYKKATRKNKTGGNRHYVDLQRQHKDPLLRKLWDNQKSLKKNMASIQLGDVLTKACTEEEAASLLPSLSERESFTVRDLLKKNQNDDFQKMARDKVNVYQWTAAVLKKKVALYRKKLMCGTAKEFVAEDIAPS